MYGFQFFPIGFGKQTYHTRSNCYLRIAGLLNIVNVSHERYIVHIPTALMQSLNPIHCLIDNPCVKYWIYAPVQFWFCKPISVLFSFSNYEILLSEKSTNRMTVWSKANEEMFYKLMEDIYSLSKCDYVICTLSSSVSMKLNRKGVRDIVRPPILTYRTCMWVIPCMLTPMQSWENSPFSKVKSSVNSFILNSCRCQKLKCQVKSRVTVDIFLKLKSSFNSFILKLMWSQLQMAHQKPVYRGVTWTWARRTIATLYQTILAYPVRDQLRRISDSIYS